MKRRPRPLLQGVVATAALVLGLLAVPPALSGQDAGPRPLVLVGADGARTEVAAAAHRGYPALPARALELLGAPASRAGDAPRRWEARFTSGATLSVRPGTPFVAVNGEWAQLVHEPYEREGTVFLPLQLFTDVLPDRIPDLFESVDSHTLRVVDRGAKNGPAEGNGSAVGGSAPADTAGDGPSAPARAADPTRVVIIDAGHGGRDPGALGPGRAREKDVTLAVALALAERLRGEPGVEVHLTRTTDTLVALWERGEIATRMKGDRYGVFLSIHANSVTQRNVRGVETYFLSEARTAHEARVAALENSVVELERNRGGGPGEGELGMIISELLNADYQHWSSELAGLVQRDLARVHPGPDRGVKQGPMAVLTNAMMPSVLVEVGFITHPDEEDLLREPAFHDDVARALARSVLAFFERYPPGQERPRAGM